MSNQKSYLSSSQVSRVASRYLQAHKVAASSASPVPLTGAQKEFLRDLATSLNSVLRQHISGSKPEYLADTAYQTAKRYKRDGFGRQSVLAGVPHARIYLSITVGKDGRVWSGGNMPAFEFLLSEDGTTAIVKADNPWGRVNKPMTSREIGTAWAKSIVAGIKRDQRTTNRPQAEEVTGLAQAEEVTGLVERRDLKPQSRGWSTNPNTYRDPTYYEVKGTGLDSNSKGVVLKWLKVHKPEFMPGRHDHGYGSFHEAILSWDREKTAWMIVVYYSYTGG